MLNYIRAEIYKLLRRKYTYIALGVMLLLEALLVGGFVFTNAGGGHTGFWDGSLLVAGMGAVGFCACMITGDVVFAGQYKNATLKNEVSFGLSRTRIYLGKFIVQTLLSIVYMVVMIVFYVGSCWLFLYQDPESDLRALQIIGYFLAVGLPLWIGGQAVACMCQFLLNGEMAASFAYVGIVFVLDGVLDILSMMNYGSRMGEVLATVKVYLPRPMLDMAVSVVGDWTFLGEAWLVGLFWVAVCTAIGLSGFYKKEIK